MVIPSPIEEVVSTNLLACMHLFHSLKRFISTHLSRSFFIGRFCFQNPAMDRNQAIENHASRFCSSLLNGNYRNNSNKKEKLSCSLHYSFPSSRVPSNMMSISGFFASFFLFFHPFMPSLHDSFHNDSFIPTSSFGVSSRSPNDRIAVHHPEPYAPIDLPGKGSHEVPIISRSHRCDLPQLRDEALTDDLSS